MRAAGKPYAEISKATGGRLYRAVGSWSTFFRNKSYLGIGKCGTLEIADHHDAAVSLQDWRKVQAISDDQASRFHGLTHPRRSRYPSLISGLAYCMKCGAAIFHHIGTRKRPSNHYYICGRRDREHGLKSCDNPRVLGKTLDALVLDLVLSRILTPSYAQELLTEIQAQFSRTADLDAQLKESRHALHAGKRAISNLLELAETFGSQAAQARLKERELEQAVRETEIRNLEARMQGSSIEITPEALQVVLVAWRRDLMDAKQNNTVGALRSMLARFGDRIDLGDHKIRIWYSWPVDWNHPMVAGSPRGAYAVVWNRLPAVLCFPAASAPGAEKSIAQSGQNPGSLAPAE
jgi:hypothetical protein